MNAAPDDRTMRRIRRSRQQDWGVRARQPDERDAREGTSMHRHSRRHGIAAVLVLTVAVAAAPGAAFGVEPDDGGPVVLFPVAIDTSAGDQFDPHLDGDLAVYTAGPNINFYAFFAGTHGQVTPEVDAVDNLSDVSNGKIVFTRSDAFGRIPILVYDVASGTTTEVDPQPLPVRTNGAIGSNTVAFIDLGLSVEGELVIADLGGSTTQITHDTRLDRQPSVAPIGDLVVYQSCATSAGNCDIRQSALAAGSWVVTPLTDNAEHEADPDTDGVVVVYDAIRSGARDIRWQPVGGGTEQVLELAGEQRNPSVSAGVVAFESVAVGATAADLFVYQIATNRLFQITSTPVDDSLNDVYTFADGRVRVVWSSGPVGSRDVYGATFELPPVEPPGFDFGGFLQPIDPRPTLNSLKAGAAVPVKFSLGGDHGLNIFETGYPRSELITCDATADVDGIEQTITAGGSSLSYDPVTDRYAYTWKTDKAWASTCRQLVLKFADGAVQRANFLFK
jgi:hypothetical protein